MTRFPRDRRRAYRGVDRRRHDEPPVFDRGLGWVYGGMLFCSVVLAVWWRAFDPPLADPSTGIYAAALVLLIVLAIVAQFEWRATGRAEGCHASTAAWLLAAAHAFALPASTVAAISVLRWMLSLLAAVWLARAFLSREVDASLRPGRQLAAAAAVTLVPAGAVWALPDLPALIHLLAAGIPALSAAIAWATVGTIGIATARRRSTTVTAWIGWLAVAKAVASLGHYLASTRSEAWLVVMGETAVLALFLAVGGAIYALFQNAQARRDRLHEVMLAQQAFVEDQLRAERERAHEMRTALLAIEGAALTLRRDYPRLDAEGQAKLDAAITAEMAHLRDLTAPRPTRSEPLHLYGLVERQAALASSASMSVEVRGDRTVRATGQTRAVVEALDNLLTNAHRYAGDETGRVSVMIEVGRENGSALVRVEDDGPGIPDGWRHLIFERGWYGDPRSGGEGLGLPVSRQLMRQLGGDLRLDAPNGGGAAFVLSLPVVTDDAGSAVGGDAGPVLDETHDGAKVLELRRGNAIRLVCGSSAGGVAGVVQDDRDVGGNGRGPRGHDGQVEPRLVGAVDDDRHLDVIPKEYA